MSAATGGPSASKVADGAQTASNGDEITPSSAMRMDAADKVEATETGATKAGATSIEDTGTAEATGDVSGNDAETTPAHIAPNDADGATDTANEVDEEGEKTEATVAAADDGTTEGASAAAGSPLQPVAFIAGVAGVVAAAWCFVT